MKLTSLHHSKLLARRELAWAGLLALSFFLAACKSEAPATVQAPPAKTIKVFTVGQTSEAATLTFAAEIRPRIETRLAFRIPGRVVQRQVEVGQVVAKGAVLARIDPQDYQLSAAAARSAQVAAEVDAKQAESDLRRQEELQRKGFISEAALEQRRSAAAAAQARVAQARAQTGAQGNQVAYTSLVASDAGVVVGLDAEVGQVVAAGQTIVRIAKLGEKDAVIAVPESAIEQVRRASSVQITSSAVAGKKFFGQVREIAPLADSATRTFAVKVGLLDAAALQLGMSAQVSFGTSLATTSPSAMRIPMSALVNQKGVSAVWIVEGDQVVERLVSVTATASESELVVTGLKAGERIVATGGHLLAKGDKVKAWVSK